MAKRYYPAVFIEEKEGGYSVRFPDLPGCFTEGDTLEQAYEMACDAIGLYLQDGDNEPVYPQPSSPQQIELKEREFTAVVEFDFTEYLKRHDSKLVKKTLSIPAWVNYAGEQKGLNFSATLTEAILEKISQ